MKLAEFAGALCLLLAATSSFAQSSYLPDGKNATILEADYARARYFESYGGDVGFSMGGMLVLGAMYEHSAHDGDRDIDWDDFKSTTVAPFLSVLALQPMPGFPVGVDCRASFGYASFEGAHVDAIDQVANGTQLNFRAKLFANITPFRGLRLQPHVAGDFDGWSVGSQLAAVDPDLDEETSELELFDSADLPQWEWSAGLSAQIADQLVVTMDYVDVEFEQPAYRLAVKVLYLERAWWR